jgi:mannose-6-phosphate isomerase-like protein (cupin superfamily)
MLTIRISIAITLLGPALWAQQKATEKSPPFFKPFTSSADVIALIAKAKSERKEGQWQVSEPLLQFAPYVANLEYRPIVGPASIHEREAEVFYVIDGSATMVVGGKLVNPPTAKPGDRSGTIIEGGTSRTIAKGDFIVVPENTPHWFSSIEGVLVLMTLHVPRPLPEAH